MKKSTLILGAVVLVYPRPVKVSYATNRVTRSGAATVLIAKEN